MTETPNGLLGPLDELLEPLFRTDAWVVGQLGQSLDGRIATVTGHSHYINGPEDIRRLHRLRAMSQAVIVGAGTVQADDPRLTVREVEGTNPVRVVLDPTGRLAGDRSVFQDGAAPTLWVQGGRPIDTDQSVPHGDQVEASGQRGWAGEVSIVRLPTHNGVGFRPQDILQLLASRGLVRVLVEGGGVTVSRFLAAGALTRLHISIAPLLLGSGYPAITLPEIETLDQALRPPVRHFPLGRDVVFDLDLDRGPG